MSTTCLKCGGTGKLVNGELCPDCSKEVGIAVPILYNVPVQYQGVRFDKSFLPEKEQSEYGAFMEELLTTIINDYAYYQKNLLICNRPNSGKTVWAYNLYAVLSSKGYDIPPLKDISEVRDIITSYTDKELANLYSTARCAIIKVPRDLQPWMFDSMSMIIERRVRNDGFTIFLFGGSEDDLRYADRYGRIKEITGTGAYNTVKLCTFNK